MTRTDTQGRRIMAIFDDRRGRGPLSKGRAGALVAAAVVLAAGLAAVRQGPSEVGPRPGTDPPTAPAVVKPPTGKGTAAPAAAKDVEPVPETYTHPITVSGRALDSAGKPVAGARVYLASLRADYSRIAETTTDADGRYKFQDVPLPIERADRVAGRDHGIFQVFGEADGFGFAWRPQKWFFPRPKPANIRHESGFGDPPSIYEAGDKIELDLRFTAPERFPGKVVDDQGKALPGVRLEIRNCDSQISDDNAISEWSLDALNQPDTAPPSMKFRTTDADGRFDFRGLPPECRMRIDVRAQGFPSRWLLVETTRQARLIRPDVPVLKGDVTLTLVRPLAVPIKLLTGDTARPAAKALVQAAEGDVNTLETTDDQGRVTLLLPPGNYRLSTLPARGTPYLVTEDRLVVGPTPPAEVVEARLRPAGVVEITVVDAETGKGIPGVDLWRQTDPDGRRELLYFRSWEVATRIAHVDRPRTDSRGTLRALVEPGRHRLGVGLESYPTGMKVVESGGQEVDAQPGETVGLIFTMRKRKGP